MICCSGRDVPLPNVLGKAIIVGVADDPRATAENQELPTVIERGDLLKRPWVLFVIATPACHLVSQ
jgi:hypothetical protein